MFRLTLLGRSLCFIQVYGPNANALCLKLVEEISYALRRIKTNESTMLLGDFNTYFGIDAGMWKGVIDRHLDAAVNDYERLLLQLCCNNGLYVINTFFQHRELHKYIQARSQVLKIGGAKYIFKEARFLFLLYV